jgi:hypothetical protein
VHDKLESQCQELLAEKVIRPKLFMDGNKTGKWTEHESKILQQAVAELGDNKRWTEVAEYLAHHGVSRGATQCRHRWHKALRPNLKKGPWNLKEDQLLVGAVTASLAVIGPITKMDWQAVADSILPERTGKACRERWISRLDPSIDRSRFTKEEDDALLSLHSTLGNKWAKISKELNRTVGRGTGKSRTPDQIKSRFISLKRRTSSSSRSPVRGPIKTPVMGHSYITTGYSSSGGGNGVRHDNDTKRKSQPEQRPSDFSQPLSSFHLIGHSQHRKGGVRRQGHGRQHAPNAPPAKAANIARLSLSVKSECSDLSLRRVSSSSLFADGSHTDTIDDVLSCLRDMSVSNDRKRNQHPNQQQHLQLHNRKGNPYQHQQQLESLDSMDLSIGTMVGCGSGGSFDSGSGGTGGVGSGSSSSGSVSSDNGSSGRRSSCNSSSSNSSSGNSSSGTTSLNSSDLLHPRDLSTGSLTQLDLDTLMMVGKEEEEPQKEPEEETEHENKTDGQNEILQSRRESEYGTVVLNMSNTSYGNTAPTPRSYKNDKEKNSGSVAVTATAASTGTGTGAGTTNMCIASSNKQNDSPSLSLDLLMKYLEP